MELLFNSSYLLHAKLVALEKSKDLAVKTKRSSHFRDRTLKFWFVVLGATAEPATSLV